MSEDMNNDTPYEPYEERLQKAVDEKRAAMVQDKNKPTHKYLMSDQQKKIAEALLRLSSNDDFKLFIECETLELSALYTNAFSAPPQGECSAMNFGEKMAFNKGRLYQMNVFRNGRDTIIKTYLDYMKHQQKGGQ